MRFVSDSSSSSTAIICNTLSVCDWARAWLRFRSAQSFIFQKSNDVGIFDIDGTLLRPDDTIISDVFDVLQLCRESGISVHIVTSREDAHCNRALTERVLAEKKICYDALHMRPHDLSGPLFKSDLRLYISTQFTVVLNIGDSWTDHDTSTFTRHLENDVSDYESAGWFHGSICSVKIQSVV